MITFSFFFQKRIFLKVFGLIVVGIWQSLRTINSGIEQEQEWCIDFVSRFFQFSISYRVRNEIYIKSLRLFSCNDAALLFILKPPPLPAPRWAALLSLLSPALLEEAIILQL